MTKPALAIIVACMALAGCQDKSVPDQAQTKPAGSTAAMPQPSTQPIEKQESATVSEKPSATNPSVVIETSLGSFTVELAADKAPATVENFLRYVEEKFYDGTIFHRVIDGFMIQGGGFTADMEQKGTHEPIINEAGNGLKNNRGTIAMARTAVVNSATAQFFVNVKDNDFLNHTDNTARGFGYAVFGKVTGGMDVVDKIKSVATATQAGMGDVPVATVTILSIRRK